MTKNCQPFEREATQQRTPDLFVDAPSRLRHILGIAILHLCAKNHKKLMSQSREKLLIDGRTDNG